MTTTVAIGNSALIKLGETQVMSFSDSSKAAKLLNTRFDMVRDSLLRSYNWSFAKARASLASSATAPDFGYLYQFDFLPEMLRVTRIGDYYVGLNLSDYNSTDSSYYKIEGRAILSNEPGPLRVTYIKRIEDPSLFDPSFTEAFACRLAYDLAESLTDSASKKQAAKEEFGAAIREAIRANAIELDPEIVADDSWVLSRVTNG